MKKTLIITLTFMLVFMTGCQTDKSANQASTTQATTEATYIEEGKLIVAMELAYPPFETKDDAGQPSGVSVDIAKAFADHLGRQLVIENTAWDGLIPSLQTGKADMVLSSMTITEQREEVVDFTKPYANSFLALLINKDSAIESVEALNQSGKVVAVKNGSTGHIYAQENLNNAEILALTEVSAAVLEVAQGKADGFIYDQLTIYRSMMDNQATTSAVFIPFQEKDKWGAAVREGNGALVEQFNEFIDQFKTNGGYDELTEKYLAEEKRVFDEYGFKWFFDLE